MRIASDVTLRKGGLPPAALQMLIENAIKHNEHTQSHPLIISITADKKRITVSNHKQLVASTDSTHMGHHNIVERYRLLTRKKVVINNTPDNYSVTIPLISTRR